MNSKRTRKMAKLRVLRAGGNSTGIVYRTETMYLTNKEAEKLKVKGK